MPLFQRTITTLATCLAAALAYALGLTYAISAFRRHCHLEYLDTSQHHQAGLPALYVDLAGLYRKSLPFSFFDSTFGHWSLYRSLCSLRLSIGLADRHHAKYGAGSPISWLSSLLPGALAQWTCSLFNWTSLPSLATYMPSIIAMIDHYYDVVEDQLKKILIVLRNFLRRDGRNDARLIKELDGILEDALNGPSGPPLSPNQLPYSLLGNARGKTIFCEIWQKTPTVVS